MKRITEDQAVVLNFLEWAAICTTLDRLYSDTPLTPDKRRDLANYLEANLNSVWVVEHADLEGK